MTDQSVNISTMSKATGSRRREGASGKPDAAPTKPKGEGNGLRAQKAAARREAILAAALDEFAAQGFAATRLDDVARRAGVAKGTIYLHFQDKEALFQELIRSVLGPFVGTLEVALKADLPVRFVAEQALEMFVREVYETRRKDVLRLILTEGQRFPHLAEFYYHEVVERALAAFCAFMQRAVERGELRSDALARFPQLLAAPAIVAIMWNGLFGRYAPIEPRELLRAHLDLLFGERRAA
jgi:AcrR family transcriptional regulator